MNMQQEEKERTEIEPLSQAVRAMQLFEEAKRKLLSQDDFVAIAGKGYIKRSGLRKIALALHISTEIVKEEVIDQPPLPLTVKVVARARSPEGRVAEDIGACDAKELEEATGAKIKATLHNVAAKAATRAINRAIADLIGGGLVSAEEISASVEEVQQEEPQEQSKKDRATESQVKYINSLITTKMDSALVDAFLSEKKVTRIEDLGKDDASKLINLLKQEG
jgi:hypothetical protein